MPALALTAFLCLWGLIERKSDLVTRILPALQFLSQQVLLDPKNFRVDIWRLAYTFFMEAELWISMILVLMVGPNLISQDLRFNALPLYFSRPLRRFDYFLGKLGVIGAFLGMVIVLPAIVAYVMGLLFSLDITIIGDTLPILLGAILYGALIVVSAGTLMLALSSLSRNSRYITLLWVVIWIVTSAVSSIMIEIDRHERAQKLRMEPAIPQSFGDYSRADLQPQIDRIEEQMVEVDKNDWRPLLSYTENLRQVGHKLLGTNSAWETFRENQPPQGRLWFRTQYMSSQYPWYWSLAVLAGLFGISAWILNRRVRSLDRLK
jgi:ABC-2 type transport system permease protein